MSNHPAEEAGRRSAEAFRWALAGQLGHSVNMAAAVAAEHAEEGGELDFHSTGGSRPSFLPRSSIGHGKPGAHETGGPDAPAYRGGAISSNAESWMKFAQSSRDKGGLGLSREQAAGVVGNLTHESGAGIAPSGVTGDHGSAHGAAQWRNERFDRLQKKAGEWGTDWRTTESQQRFMRWEMDNKERGSYAALRVAKTPEQAAHIFNRQYERSADPGVGRRKSARRIFDQGAPSADARKEGKPIDRATADGLLASPGRHPDLRHVDPRLREIMAAASTHLPEGYTMRINEGYNPSGHVGNSQHHIEGRGALDVQIFDPHGKPIANRGRDTTGMYTRLGRAAYGEMQARHPDLDGKLAHGSSFGTSRGSGVPDLMHFDLGGERGNLGPHLSTLGALPGEHYGEPKQQETAQENK